MYPCRDKDGQLEQTKHLDNTNIRPKDIVDVRRLNYASVSLIMTLNFRYTTLIRPFLEVKIACFDSRRSNISHTFSVPELRGCYSHARIKRCGTHTPVSDTLHLAHHMPPLNI